MNKAISKTIKLLAATTLFVALFGLSISGSDLRKNHNGDLPALVSKSTWVANAKAQTAEETVAEAAAAEKANQDKMGAESEAQAKTDLENQAASEQQGGEGGSGSPEVKTTPDPAKMVETVAKLASYVNLIFNPLIHFITFKIGPFLGNDYIFGGNMGTMLKNIWVTCRNIVNIVFVLVLLYLALKHIVKGEDSDIAKSLPTFVIMLVAINFSWLAGRMILDAANVATNVVFAIPASMGTGGSNFDAILAKDPCIVNTENNTTKGNCVVSRPFIALDADTTIYYDDSKCTEGNVKKWEKWYSDAYPKPGGKKAEETPASKTNILCWKTLQLGDYEQNNASYYLSYSMARVQNLIRSTSNDLINTAVGTMFSLALQIAYLAAFLSLFIVLIIRAAMMWILMAFSPFIVLLMYLDKAGIKADAGEASKYLSVSAFTDWAFAPAKVGAVWTVGFIMITAGQTMESSFETTNTNIYGAGTLFMGMDTIQQFIWFAMTLGVVWVGTFSVFTKLEFAGKITDKIKGFVESGASMAGKTFVNKVPIIPIHDEKGGGSKNIPIGDLFRQKEALQNWIDGKTRGENKANFSGDETKVSKVKAAAKSANENPKEFSDELRKVLGEMGIKDMKDYKDHEYAISNHKELIPYLSAIKNVLEDKLADGTKKVVATPTVDPAPSDTQNKLKTGADPSAPVTGK
jgi:hypothetical protein